MILKIHKGCWDMKMCGSQKSFNEPKPVQYFDLVSALRNNTNSAWALFSKPRVAAGLPLAAHCQLQEIGPFYQDGANLG